MRDCNHAPVCNLPEVSESNFQKYENKLGGQTIKQLLNSVIAKCHDLSVSRI